MMHGLDTETLDMTLAAISDFAGRELDDERLIELDEADEYPAELIRRMCSDELGIQLLFIAEEHGGMGGSAYDVYRVCERMARIDLGVATSVLATFLGSDPILMGGTDEQQHRWMSRIANEGLLMAYGATEAEAGSDLGTLKTVAVPVSEDGEVVGYRITGQKQWISNGAVADLYSILAGTDKGPTWFILEKGLEGFSAAKPENKHGIRLSNTAALYLDDVYVAADALVGTEEGQGLVQAQQVFGYTRLMVAAFGLGGGWEALDRAIAYSKERIQGGGPLSEKQGYTHKLIVPHALALEAGRAYIEETAERIDEGTHGHLNTEGAIAKYIATEAGNAAADAAIQALGGYGYTHDYMVEKIRRDVRITTIYEGTSEIMEMTIARDRWQEHLKSRGAYYHDRAAELEATHADHPSIGADLAALAHHALAEVLEAARVGRLTRNQHVLFKLGELMAETEASAALVRRAARAATGELPAKADRRFDAAGVGEVSRAHARRVAQRVADEGTSLVVAADGAPDVAALTSAVGTARVLAAQAGGVADLDRVADLIYGRT
ncbi:MAG: acyl-CoA dehydrogenase family protein [Nitriliruptoraceae bacterium]